MLIPNFQFLQIEQDNGFLYKGFDRPEGNPRFFMYRYFVFWEGSPVDGMEFFSDENSMTRTEAGALIARLEKEGKAHWVYNRSHPREGGPFDPEHPRWKDRIFASALEIKS